jgi:hypothetical protein
MSTTNPDDRRREIEKRFVPYAIAFCFFGLLSAPVFAVINLTSEPDDNRALAFFLIYLGLTVIGGLLAYYAPGQRPPLGMAAYIVAYVAGLLLVMGSADPLDDPDSLIHKGFWVAAVPIVAAIVLTVLYVLRVQAVRQTKATGVDTTATVESAGVDGMINYVQHQRLTLSFTDQQGVKRYLRIGRTGGGYAAGNTVPLRYDPARPWSKRSIIVGT